MLYSQEIWVPVTTAWYVLGLPIEVRPPIWKVAANILNKLSCTAEKVGSLGVVWYAENSSPLKSIMLQNII